VNAKKAPPVIPVGPTAPKLTSADLLRQFWTDAYGKEVQTAATYSYTWLADQFGHVCLGIIFNFLATALSSWVMAGFSWNFEYNKGLWPGLLLVVLGAAAWEWSAYNKSVKQATGRFPLDTRLLRNNAIVATVYIALGAVLGFAFRLPHILSASLIAIVLVVAIFLAPWWLRQKIVWQKASLPYLFRLADVAAATVQEADAKILQKLIDDGAPPFTHACQVVIGGPIGSGRTAMAAGIGTEFAFKKHKVRYLSLDSLLEFAANATGGTFPDDPGPTTISYWPWSQSQVVIIDGVGPMIATNEQGHEANIERFKAMLQRDLGSVAGVLKNCHTIWVLGDLCPPPPREQLEVLLAQFAKALADHFESKRDPLLVELSSPPELQPKRSTVLPTTRREARATAVQRVCHVDRNTAKLY
jgi:hypothetical protein